MNYRHIYHAGNFADVIKHLALALSLDYLKKKDAPICVIDAHGGIGLYDLLSEQAGKTGEWVEGIGRISDIKNPPDDLNLYLSLVRPYLSKHIYPGSPVIISDMLRAQDRLIANELHPEDVRTLKENVPGAQVTHLDAYECIRAHIPPAEKRGLVLIDPPFEQRDEFETLQRQMGEWKKRWPTGVYILWYPIKAHLAVSALKEAARNLGLHRTWNVEIFKHPPAQADTFNGTGLLVFNAPFGVAERMQSLLPLLKDAMGLYDTNTRWIVGD